MRLISGIFNRLTPQEARLIAKDAFIYAYPMVDNYRILFAFFLSAFL